MRTNRTKPVSPYSKRTTARVRAFTAWPWSPAAGNASEGIAATPSSGGQASPGANDGYFPGEPLSQAHHGHQSGFPGSLGHASHGHHTSGHASAGHYSHGHHSSGHASTGHHSQSHHSGLYPDGLHPPDQWGAYDGSSGVGGSHSFGSEHCSWASEGWTPKKTLKKRKKRAAAGGPSKPARTKPRPSLQRKRTAKPKSKRC
ncbi:hypothetical protein JJQ72_15695 [Paenibacillus sp. F411]|uniref:hypothetical protein n=1 Tax=Paenibacillus sp. F411 TaxID=2820239 RepID=UPI001AAE72B9|nr:hypothetical protein [Paenibacillus sp. F411]MBO2945420.1 hypothetical protein [Paenibacillus sp. F411]